MGANALLTNKTARIKLFFFFSVKLSIAFSNLTASVLIFFLIFIMDYHCAWHSVRWTKARIRQYKGAESERAK